MTSRATAKKGRLLAGVVMAVGLGLLGGTFLYYPIFSLLLGRELRFDRAGVLIISVGIVICVLDGLCIMFLRKKGIPPGRCPACGYDLTGNVSGICPECGKPTAPHTAGGTKNPADD